MKPWTDDQELAYYRQRDWDIQRVERQQEIHKALLTSLKEFLPRGAFKEDKDHWGTVAPRAEVLVSRLEVLIQTMIDTAAGRPKPPVNG